VRWRLVCVCNRKGNAHCIVWRAQDNVMGSARGGGGAGEGREPFAGVGGMLSQHGCKLPAHLRRKGFPRPFPVPSLAMPPTPAPELVAEGVMELP
jgi:hypothetical protein